MGRALALGLVLVTAGGLATAPGANSGDVWKRLHRPLHLPHLGKSGSCPATGRRRVVQIYYGQSVGYGRGPFYPLFPYRPRHAALALPLPEFSGQWVSQSLRWFAKEGLQDRALIRGRRLDGAARIRFGKDGRSELRFPWTGEHRTTVRFRTGGCYAFQIDTTRSSRVVVFRVEIAPRRDSRRVVEALRAAGLPLEPADASTRPWLFGLTARSYEAPAGRIQLFEFPDAYSAITARNGISSDGTGVSSPGQVTLIDFIGPPHWFLMGAALVLYVGDNPEMLGPLEQALGPQFAGM
jgi:hypothetical protein